MSLAAWRTRISAYHTMTRPRIVLMVMITTAWGYLLGAQAEGVSFPGVIHLLATIIGTALAAGGGTVLNHYLERDADALMSRTRRRPIPAGLVSPNAALSFGLLLVLGGLALLLWQVSLLAAFLVLLSDFLYVLVYTPMKRYSPLNTSFGAIPGAIPPLVGWSAVRGELGVEGWLLFAILFVWQHPHVYAIAWMYREDYARAGFKMLSLNDDGTRTARAVLAGTIALMIVSVLPVVWGSSASIYLVTAVVTGLLLIHIGLRMSGGITHASARSMLKATVLYLPLLLASTIADALL